MNKLNWYSAEVSDFTDHVPTMYEPHTDHLYQPHTDSSTCSLLPLDCVDCWLGHLHGVALCRQEQQQLDQQIAIDEALIREREEHIRQLEVRSASWASQKFGKICSSNVKLPFNSSILFFTVSIVTRCQEGLPLVALVITIIILWSFNSLF